MVDTTSQYNPYHGWCVCDLASLALVAYTKARCGDAKEGKKREQLHGRRDRHEAQLENGKRFPKCSFDEELVHPYLKPSLHDGNKRALITLTPSFDLEFQASA